MNPLRIRTVPLTVFGATRQAVALFSVYDDADIGTLRGPDARKQAEHIRVCCNNHADMIVAMELILKRDDELHFLLSSERLVAEAALKLAKGEQ